MNTLEASNNSKDREELFRTIKKKKKVFKSIELMGVTDIAELMNLDKSTISNMHKRGKFVEPLGMIGGRPVWLKEEILFYMERKRGGYGKGGS